MICRAGHAPDEGDRRNTTDRPTIWAKGGGRYNCQILIRYPPHRSSTFFGIDRILNGSIATARVEAARTFKQSVTMIGSTLCTSGPFPGEIPQCVRNRFPPCLAVRVGVGESFFAALRHRELAWPSCTRG